MSYIKNQLASLKFLSNTTPNIRTTTIDNQLFFDSTPKNYSSKQRVTMSRLVQSQIFSSTLRAKVAPQTRPIHNVSLAPLHQILHTTTESAPKLQGLHLHDHHSYQAPTPNTPTQGATNISLVSLHQTLHQQTDPAPQLHGIRLHDHHGYQNQNTVSVLQKSNMSTSVKESKIAKELREACARATAVGREMDFREVHGRTRTSRDLTTWEIPVSAESNTPTQVVMSNAIANVALAKEKRQMTEAKSNAIVRRRMNPILTRVRLETKNLCAADLDNIYNL